MYSNKRNCRNNPEGLSLAKENVWPNKKPRQNCPSSIISLSTYAAKIPAQILVRYATCSLMKSRSEATLLLVLESTAEKYVQFFASNCSLISPISDTEHSGKNAGINWFWYEVWTRSPIHVSVGFCHIGFGTKKRQLKQTWYNFKSSNSMHQVCLSRPQFSLRLKDFHTYTMY